MAERGSEETPLIFATQTSATIADLNIEGSNPEELPASNVGSNVSVSDEWCHVFSSEN